MANHIDAVEPGIGRGVWDLNLEFGVDLVEEEDWACRLRDRHWRYRGALVDRWLRILQGVPKIEVAIAIVGR